jgi:endonuclease YncB( thermonuclease family)
MAKPKPLRPDHLRDRFRDRLWYYIPGGQPSAARRSTNHAARKCGDFQQRPHQRGLGDGAHPRDRRRHDRGHARRRHCRLVNIDTPETGSRARCPAERTLGDRATNAARALIAQARRLELNPTGRIDRYGRTIAFVVIDGHDMGETLIAEGLARPWRGRREPWCDADGNLIP